MTRGPEVENVSMGWDEWLHVWYGFVCVHIRVVFEALFAQATAVAARSFFFDGHAATKSAASSRGSPTWFNATASSRSPTWFNARRSCATAGCGKRERKRKRKRSCDIAGC